MKNEKSRNRGYYRKQRKRIIKRKSKILKHLWANRDFEDFCTDKNLGKLSKGKVHCSCWMCSTKTNDPFHGWKPRDKKILKAMENEIIDYFNNEW